MIPNQKDKTPMKPREIKASDGAGEGSQFLPGPEYCEDMKSVVLGKVTLEEMKALAGSGKRKRELRGPANTAVSSILASAMNDSLLS